MTPSKKYTFKEVAVVVIIVIALAIFLDSAFDISPQMKLSWVLQADVNVTYQDLAATLLGAAGLVLAALAMFLAVLTFFGYGQMKREASKSAIKEVQASIAAEDGKLQRLVKQETQQAVERIFADVRAGILTLQEWGNQDREYGE
jgi:hypothetical protein